MSTTTSKEENRSLSKTNSAASNISEEKPNSSDLAQANATTEELEDGKKSIIWAILKQVFVSSSTEHEIRLFFSYKLEAR